MHTCNTMSSFRVNVTATGFQYFQLLLTAFVLADLCLRYASVHSKIYEPCALAQEMVQKHRFPLKDIADWICLIRHESNFDTTAIGNLNSDGSLDHGLFQISDKYWCNTGKDDGACGINCSDLVNDDIADDSVCARRIFRITKFNTKNGFDAWVAWKQNCQGRDVSSYIKNCNLTILRNATILV